ncbi:MAG: (d)CMP kinase [Eubacterium sp.]|nr:(d)CMP kinase [Eubacterium sp.]
MGFQIAIDGPAGAGKSTIAKAAASELGFVYIDTGAMYRALGLFCLRKGINIQSEEDVTACLQDAEVDLDMSGGIQHVLLNGEDVNGYIRTEEVGMAASVVSRYKEVRAGLVGRQQKIAGSQNIVMDGRDIGTVVLPDAQLKIFLTAGVHVRALRRQKDLEMSGKTADLKEIEKDIEERDLQDRTRKESPLVQAPDAVYLDTSDMTISEVTDYILNLAETRMAQGREL